MMKSLILALFLVGCSVKPDPAPPVVPPAADISTVVEGSKCADYFWKSRGKAPIGYIKGMAYSYSKAVCRLYKKESGAVYMAKTAGEASKDALAYYGIKASGDTEALKKNFAFLIGLGMRESSGNYGEGRDKTATNTDALTAESGLFQFSYNLNSATPELQKLYTEYKSGNPSCYLDVFREGVKKPFDTSYAGTGEGLVFQKLARTCPAFAAEYAAVGIRAKRAHWGPINRKEVEFREECVDMLEKVRLATVCQ